MGIYLSMSIRVLANVEALNAVESLGNIVRHRKAFIVIPIEIRQEGGRSVRRLELRSVPVVSGEALRHSYQLVLVELAKQNNVNVCNYCSIGEFVKHGVVTIIEQQEADLYKILTNNNIDLASKELKVLEMCVVEDVGGFLIPMRPYSLRRTSKIHVSFMIPSLADMKYALDTQFHVRNTPHAQQVVEKASQGREVAQAPYYIESSSAVYTFTVNIDLSEIGVTSNCDAGFRPKSLNGNERLKRVKLAILALGELIKSGYIGGKQSSYRPHWIPLSAVAVVSKPIRITAYPGHEYDYIKKTVEIAKSNAELIGGEDYRIVAFVNKNMEVSDVVDSLQGIGNEDKGKIEVVENIATMFSKIINVVNEWFTGQPKATGTSS